MRNLKRALSLTLASVMLLGMMVVGAGAASYPDVDESNNIEAIEVLQAVKVMEGDSAGNFDPDRPVSRAEMAVIMALLLNLDYDYYRGTKTFNDVPNWCAPYVAACYANGIISGYNATTYGSADTVNAVQAASMVMRALGYFKYSEDYEGDFVLSTVKQASKIELFKGINANSLDPLTRNQVAQLALNALRSDMVDFTGTPGMEVNGVKVGYRAEYTPRTSTEGKYNAITGLTTTILTDNGQYFVQLGEQLYQGKLRLRNDIDAFGRPARKWEYDGKGIGTYAKVELLRETYTDKVTGKMLYDLLGASTIKDYEEFIYVDGESAQSVLGSYYFDENNMIRTNTSAVGGTGNGVLTEVYVDTIAHETTIAIINTYLAKATKDYDEKNNEARFDVYNVRGTGGTSTYVKDATRDGSARVSDEDFALVKDVKDEDLYLVTLAQGEVQSMVKPEVLSSTTITSFSRTNWVNAGGTKYDYASTAKYNDEVLDQYDNKNMKNLTYNVILDKYGYLIGLELNEDPDQYVFLTGVEGDLSNLGTRNVDGNVIFLDGTMRTVTINGKDSELNIPAGTNNSQVNAWYTYSVNSDNTYVLERVANGTRAAVGNVKAIKVAQSAQSVGGAVGNTFRINQRNNVSLKADAFDPASTVKVAYGNKDTVYLGVSTTKITADHQSSPRVIIDDVETISTGILNVDLLVKELGTSNGGYANPANEVYTLYKDNGAIIAVVAIGEDNGAGSNLVFITGDDVNQEDDNGDSSTRAAGDGKYTWYLKAIVQGESEERNITEVGNNASILNKLKQNTWYELRFDADGNVRKVDEDSAKDADRDGYYDGIDFTKAKYLNVISGIVGTVPNEDTVVVFDTTTVDALRYVGNTLYTTTNNSRGFPVAGDVESFLILAGGNGNGRGADWYDEVRDEYHGPEGLQDALDDMNAASKNPLPTLDSNTTMTVEISAVLKNGVATTIIINDKNPNPAKNPGSTGTQNNVYVAETKLLPGNIIEVTANVNPATPGDNEVMIAAWNWLVSNGYRVLTYTNGGSPANPWTFSVTRGDNGLPVAFTTQLVSVTGIYVNNVQTWVKTGSKYIFAGDYRTASESSHADAETAVTSGSVTGSVSTGTAINWSLNGKYFIDGLYKVSVVSNGTAAAGTAAYYKMGDKITLDGSWYKLGTSAANTGTDYISTADVVMSEALRITSTKDVVIYDSYYHVTAPASATEAGTAVDEYVIDGGNSTAQVVKDAEKGLYALTTGGTYVLTNSDGKVTSVDKDCEIVEGGYARVEQAVDVTCTASDIDNSDATKMAILASVDNNTYVKAGDTLTIRLTIQPNGTKATTAAVDFDASAATVNSQAVTDPADDITVVDQNADTLKVNNITITVPNLSTVTGGKVQVAITFIDHT